VLQAAGAVEHVRQRRRQTDGHQRQLKDVGVGDRPHPAQHGVRRGHHGGEQDCARQIHPEQDAERRTDRDEQLGAPEQFAGKRRKKQDGRPSFPKTGFEGIDQRGEPVAAHDAGEHQAAEHQADAEAKASLNAQLNRILVRAFRGAEQVAAIDPRGGHRQRRDPDRHRAPRDDQVGSGPLADLPRRQPANDHEGGVHRDDGQYGAAHNLTVAI
jgi:hypothetical protein